MQKLSNIFITLAIIISITTTANALPDGAIRRLSKGNISSEDRAVQYSPDGSLLAVATSVGVFLYDGQIYEDIGLLDAGAYMYSVAFSPDGTALASGSYDNSVKLWDVTSGQQIKTLTGHTSSVRSVAFSPDGTTLASGSWDNSVKLWDVTSGQQIKTLTGHTNRVNSVAFSPDGTTLASGSDDGTVLLWNMGPRPKPFDLLSPQDKAWTNPTPSFDWGDSECELGFSRYELWIDGNLSVGAISQSQYTLTSVQSLSDGSHTWTVKAVDNEDNMWTANQTWTVKVDTTPPSSCDLVSPSNNAYAPAKPTFDWEDSGSGISHYELWLDGNLTQNELSTSQYQLTDAQKLSDGEHTWTIKAVDAIGNKKQAEHSWTVKIDTTVPATPLGLQAKAGDNQIDLSWDANPDTDLSHYMIYRSETGGFTPTQSDFVNEVSQPNTSFTDTDLTNGTTYDYRISAVDNAENESGFSDEASAMPNVPSPKNLMISFTPEGNKGIVNLSWEAPEDEDIVSYKVYRSTI